MLPRRAVLKVTMLAPFAKQLLREACLLEALDHPGVPQVFESGLLPDRRPWFAAEMIEGETLAEQLARGPLSPLEVARLVRDLGALLEHAHRRGVVHRALHPERILITPHRRFGLCLPDWTEARTHDAAPTIPHVPAPGARHYVAPELARGHAVDDRADIFALGVIAFRALTGAHPYASAIDGRKATHDAAPGAPRELAQLIDQMLALDRFDRPSSTELRAELDWLARMLAVDATPPAPIEDLILDDTVAPTPRIRRPRWTPSYAQVVSEAPDEAADPVVTPTRS